MAVCRMHVQTIFASREAALEAAQGRAGARAYHSKACGSWHVSTRGGRGGPNAWKRRQR